MRKLPMRPLTSKSAGASSARARAASAAAICAGAAAGGGAAERLFAGAAGGGAPAAQAARRSVSAGRRGLGRVMAEGRVYLNGPAARDMLLRSALPEQLRTSYSRLLRKRSSALRIGARG
jgi:hypothetical protein